MLKIQVIFSTSLNLIAPKQMILNSFYDLVENACQGEAFWQDNGGMTMERKNSLIKVKLFDTFFCFFVEKTELHLFKFTK